MPGHIYSVMEERFQLAISESPCYALSQRVLMQNSSYENEFDFHENELTDETQFNNFFLVRQKQSIHLILT